MSVCLNSDKAVLEKSEVLSLGNLISFPVKIRALCLSVRILTRLFLGGRGRSLKRMSKSGRQLGAIFSVYKLCDLWLLAMYG